MARSSICVEPWMAVPGTGWRRCPGRADLDEATQSPLGVRYVAVQGCRIREAAVPEISRSGIMDLSLRAFV